MYLINKIINFTYPASKLIGQHGRFHSKSFRSLFYIDCSRSHGFQYLLGIWVRPVVKIVK